MASEVLAIPEDHLLEVIRVIRAGLEALGKDVTKETQQQLKKWCDEEEAYMRRFS